MAEIRGKTVIDDNKYALVSWVNITGDDTPQPVALGKLADKTVQFTGAAGGATVELHGSMDGTNYVALTKDGTNKIAFSATAMQWIWENPKFIKPVVTNGDSATAFSVYMGASALI